MYKVLHKIPGPYSYAALDEMLLNWKMVISTPTMSSPVTGVPALFT